MPPEVLWTVPETGMPSFAELGLPAADPVRGGAAFERLLDVCAA